MQKTFIFQKIISIAMLMTIFGIVIYQWFITPNFRSFQISDWLINYQDGFIRRGFFGTILFYIYNHFYNVSPITTILLIDTIFFILFWTIVFRIFKKRKWSFATAMFSVVTPMAMLGEYRRDFMMMLLCYISFLCFFSYIKKKNVKLLLMSVITMTISILIYEPIFFVLVPITLLQFWYFVPKGIATKTLCTAIVFFLPFFCMTMSCVYNGTVTQTDNIWNSWMPIIKQFAGEEEIEKGVSLLFMENSNKEIFLDHLCSNFGTTPLEITCSVILLSFVFLCVYYICTYMPIIDNRNKNLFINENSQDIGRILLFQLIIQLPMFTILSTDYGRTIPYSIFTTYFILYLSSQYNINIYVSPIIEKISSYVYNLFEKIKILQYYPIYFFIMLIFPLRIWPSPHYYDNIIVHFFIRFNKYILN